VAKVIPFPMTRAAAHHRRGPFTFEGLEHPEAAAPLGLLLGSSALALAVAAALQLLSRW
jgi:hypothetical protein